jgi:iron-sulfur cluster assembly protein
MITLTEAAADRVREFLEKRGTGEGLRFGVKESGCSGYSYVVNYADEIGPEDLVFETHGVKVIVDPKSVDVVEGTEIDFVKDGLNETFQFNNPNSTDACGCGESFNV